MQAPMSKPGSMNVAAKAPNSKFHSNPPVKTADMTMHGVDSQISSHSVTTGLPKDTPGQMSGQFVSNDYGQGRHLAYDSPLAQPAYDGSGKVKVGTTSVL